MQQAIEKADTLIEALGWIRQFRDKTTVIKLGGSVLGNEDALRHILIDIHFMETVGMRPVVVHGAGHRISAAMEAAGVEPNFIQGRRVTDAATLEIVEKVLAEETNEFLATEFNKIGGNAKTLNFQSMPVLKGQKLKLLDVDQQPVDLGFVGEITAVDCGAIGGVCSAGQVPFIPAMCEDENGQKLNVNADSVATVVAQQLKADKLVFLSDVKGVLTDPTDPETLVSALTPSLAKELIESGKIAGGMLPKVEACLETLNHGVNKVHIVDGLIRHSLLLEVYTTSGVGTLILDDQKAQAI